jgi:hypothetical protein
MKSLRHGLLAALGLLGVACALGFARAAAPDQETPTAQKQLTMSPAVVCEKIAGYEDYVLLKDAALTKDDKLLVYYRPSNYTVKKEGDKFQMHLTQDVRVRRRGQKEVLWSKKVVDEKLEFPGIPTTFYLMNKIAVQALTPGEYDLDIILHDELAQGPPAQQVLRFTVKPSRPSEPAPSEEEKKTAKPGRAERWKR